MKHILAILSLLIFASCTGDTAEVLSYGIVKNRTIGTEVSRDLVAGEKHIIDTWNLLKETTNIPSDLGIEFGIAYKVSAPFYRDSVTIEEVLIFPGEGLTNPANGRSAKVDSERQDIDPREEQYFTYALDYPWEVKSGIWIFQVKQDDQLLLEKSFYVQP